MSARRGYPASLMSLGAERQRGMTLMELIISLALSVVVTSAMVMLMANSLGATSRIVLMTELTDQLRNAMRMMTRDVRRANYTVNSAFCYGNSDCGEDGSADQYSDIDVTDGSCFMFGLDRNFDGDATDDDAGAFRHRQTSGVGRIEMWVGDNDPDCSAANDADWVPVTDPDFVDITAFNVNDAESFSESATDSSGVTITQRARQIQVQIEGRLIRDNRITRRMEDVIKVRNDFVSQS